MEIEIFFWKELADNYLEMAKKRLYDKSSPTREGAQYAIFHALLALLKLLAPFLPYVTEVIYQALFARLEGNKSVHLAAWPEAKEDLIDAEAERIGEILKALATAVRRYRSTANIALGAEIFLLQAEVDDAETRRQLQQAEADILSITRAKNIVWCLEDSSTDEVIELIPGIRITVGEQ